MEELPVVCPKAAVAHVAEAESLLQDGAEYWREVAGRGIDDAEHFGGRGLLLQGLARLGEEPRILHRDHRLRREILQQCDLLVAERGHLLSVNRQDAENIAVLDKRCV